MWWELRTEYLNPSTHSGMRIENFVAFLIFVYASSSIIYWFVGLDPQTLNLLKMAAFMGMLASWVFMVIRNRIIAAPVVYMSLISYAVLVTILIIGLIFGAQSSLIFLIDLLFPFLTIHVVVSLEKLKDTIYRYLRYASLIVSAFCVLTITNYLLGVPGWTSPFTSLPLSSAGFHSARTGWSNSLYPFFLILMIYAFTNMQNKKENRLRIFVCMAAGIIILLSQFFSGGRNGLFASLFGLFFFLYFRRTLDLRVVIVTIVGLVVLFYNLPTIYEFLRIEDTDNLTDISTGRIEGYVEALSIIENNLWFGIGYNNADLKELALLSYDKIHNFWLRSFAEGGIFYFLALISIFIKLIFDVFRDRRNVITVVMYKAILLGMLIISMFEPAVPFGTFNNNFVFWVMTGLFWAERRFQQDQGRHE